jgi:hypothetical protein
MPPNYHLFIRPINKKIQCPVPMSDVLPPPSPKTRVRKACFGPYSSTASWHVEEFQIELLLISVGNLPEAVFFGASGKNFQN